jgi:hypothetical protein
VAAVEGAKAALWGLPFSAGVLAAVKYSPLFRARTNTSSRVAMAISPALLLFAFRSERTLYRANMNPEAFGIKTRLSDSSPVMPQTASTLPWYGNTANYLYTHPFQMVAGMALPAVGGILWEQRKHPHLKFSQQIMHTRVFGQMAAVSILITTMVFRDLMSRTGGLFTEEGREHESGMPEPKKALEL